jgi:phosphinothricin acetyltransferase
MRPEDWPEVEAIYREGLATGNASFEAEPPAWEAFDAGKLGVGRLVAVDADGGVTGWVAASAVSTREVYRGVVEHSVYVAARVRGGGVGRALLAAFVEAMDAAGYGPCSRASSRTTTRASPFTSAGFAASVTGSASRS